MIVTTGFDIAGYHIKEYKGLVRGIIVRSPTIGQGLSAAWKMGTGGGQNPAYMKMCEQARQEALASMLDHAHGLGANAVIGVRYDASELQAGVTEVLCYGTAVVIEESS
jgi:uncharacterized protein YbjQ (UPF0145 family)